jgi:hypothetical protein
MAGGYFATVTIAQTTGETADSWQNTLSLQALSTISPNLLEVWTDTIWRMYEGWATNGLLRGAARIGHMIKVYEARVGINNFPIIEVPYSFGSQPGAVDLPREVALCISFRAQIPQNIPRARGRGRIFVPGFPESSNDAGRPTPSVQGTLGAGYGNYFNDTLAIDAPIFPGVFSRTQDFVYPIVEAWVDNEWDTQRRRGTRPTSRLEVPLD